MTPPEDPTVETEEALPANARPAAWVALATAENGAIDARGRKVRAVRFPHGRWTIRLDAFTEGETQSTRMAVRFRTGFPLRLSIRRHNLLTRFAARFGGGGLQVPDPALARAFLVRTDGASIVRSLLLDRRLTAALSALPRGRLEVVPARRGLRRLPDAADLRWVTGGVIKDVDVLHSALRLMRQTLDGLARLGVAKEPIRPA